MSTRECYCKTADGNLEKVNSTLQQSQQPQQPEYPQSQIQPPETTQSPQLQQSANVNSLKEFANRLFASGKALVDKHINSELGQKVESVASQLPQLVKQFYDKFDKPPSFSDILNMVRDKNVRSLALDAMKNPDARNAALDLMRFGSRYGGKTKRVRRKTRRRRQGRKSRTTPKRK
jgi:hypothetical protein